MAELVHTIYESLKNLFETTFEVVHDAWHVVYTFVSGLILMLWHTLESFASFLGASVNFVVSNIVILILVFIGLYVYRSKGAPRNKAAKKVE